MTLRTRTYHSMAKSLNALESMTKKLNESMFFEVGPDGQGTARRPVRPSRRSNAANRHEPVSDGYSRNGLSKYDNMTEDDLYRSVWPLLHGQVMAPTDGLVHRTGSFQKSPNVDTYLEYLNKSFGHQSSRALKVMAQRAGIVLIKSVVDLNDGLPGSGNPVDLNDGLPGSGQAAPTPPAPKLPKPNLVTAGDIDARIRPATGGGDGSVNAAGSNPSAVATAPPVHPTLAAGAKAAGANVSANGSAKERTDDIYGGIAPPNKSTLEQKLVSAYHQLHTGAGRQSIANAAQNLGLQYSERSGVHHLGDQDHMSYAGAAFNAGALARAGFLQRFESPNLLRFHDKNHEDEWMQSHDLDNTRQSNMIRTNDGFAVVKVAHPTKKGESMLFAYNHGARSWVPVSGIENNPRSPKRGGNGTTIRHWGDVANSGDYVRHVASTLNTLLGSSDKFNDYNTLTPNLANKATRESVHAGMPGNNARHDASIKVSPGQFVNDVLNHSHSAWTGLQQKGKDKFELPAEGREGEDTLAEEGAPEQAAGRAADTETRLLPAVGKQPPPVGLDDPDATRRYPPEELEQRRVDRSGNGATSDATQQLTPEHRIATKQLAAVKNFVEKHPHIAQSFNWHAETADKLLDQLQNNPSDPNAIRDAGSLFNTIERARNAHYNTYEKILSQKGLDEVSRKTLRNKFSDPETTPEERRQMWEHANNQQNLSDTTRKDEDISETALSDEERQGLLGASGDSERASGDGERDTLATFPQLSYNPHDQFQATTQNLQMANKTIDDLYAQQHRGQRFPPSDFVKKEEMLNGLANGKYSTIQEAYDTVMQRPTRFAQFRRPGPGAGFFSGKSMSVHETDEYIAKMMNRMYGYGVSQSINNIRKSHGR